MSLSNFNFEKNGKKTILLVEDEALIAMNEARMLQKHGYEVVTAYNAIKAISAVEENPIDLILMDIDLGSGKMDGTEAAERIMRNHDLPVVFLSSHTEPDVVEKTGKITSYGYIVKNSGNTVLLTSIKMAFRLFEANHHIKKHEENLLKEKERLQHYIGVIEERQKLDNEKQRFLFQLYERMDFSKEKLFNFVLDSSIRITSSEYGFSGFINDDESIMTIHRWSNNAMDTCAMSDKPIEFPIKQAGIWGDCVRERKPIIINDYKNSTLKTKHGLPEGHIEIKSFLCIPVFDGKKIVAVGAVANKDIPYNTADVDALTLLYDKMWGTLQKQEQNKKLEESKLRFHQLFNSMTEGVCIHQMLYNDLGNPSDYIIKDVNPAYEKILNISRSDTVGKLSTEVYSTKEPPFLNIYSEVVETEKPYQFETYYRPMDKHFLISVFSMGQEHFATVFMDITAQKSTEENLRITLSSIGDAVISTDIGGNVTRMNPVAENLTGWSIDAAKGKSLNEVFHIINTDTRETVDNPVEKVLQQGEVIGLGNHTVLISKNGQECQIADSAAPIKDEEGNINGVVLVFRDVTEQYEKDRQLRERVKELDCLYKIAEIVEEPNASLNYILQQTAEVIPQSWRYPENCECRITLNNERFQSNNFSETKWKLRSDIIVEDVISGEVVVCYLDERPTIDEGPFLKEERKLLDAIAERLGRVIERYNAEEKLRSIEWMLSNKTARKEDFVPEYGDVSSLNKDGLILTSVGKEQLKNITSEYLDLLETSTAIYEKNGDYALGIFSSGWCRLMDTASGRLCNTEDNQKALESGKWLCHESCWKDAYLSMKEGKPVEIECNGGINMYAVPVRANDEIVGAINFGYGNPPTDEAELKRLSEIYNISIDELRKNAEAYKPRPQFIIDYAKERIQTAAKTLGYLIERKQTEEALKRETFFLSSVMDNIKEAIIICNEKGEIIRFNESARTLHNLPEKQIPAEQWAEYYDLYYPDKQTLLATEDIPLFRALQGEDVINAEIIVKPKNSPSRLLSCSGNQLIDNNGNKLGAVIAMHDITELKNSREKYRRLVNNSPNLIMETDLDTHEIISCNPAMAKNLGATIPEIVGRKIDDFIPPDILRKRIEVSQKAFETGELLTLEDERKGKYFQTTYVPIVSDDRRSIQTITIDITEQKTAEKLLQRQKENYELIFNNSMDGILFTSPDGTIYSANPSACEILETSEEEMIEKGRESIVDTNDPRLAEALRQRSKYGSFRGELGFKKKTGEVVPVELTTKIFENSAGEQRTCIFFRDISEQKQREQVLLDAMKEKDFLMKELNHRIKNNLALVSSLISLKEVETEYNLSELKHRIEVIQLVHEKLHQQNDIEHIEVRKYFQELLESVFSSTSRWAVDIINNIEDVSIPTKTAIPLGLIVNEIATNAIKYGFTADEKAHFIIELNEDEEHCQYVLVLSNTGNPFPEDIELENTETMGLQLVFTLVTQLNGTIELQKKPNPVFTIIFPMEESRKTRKVKE